MTAVQDGPTSIIVTWTPTNPLDGITGYRISFTGGGSSDSVDVSRGNSMSHTLTGLTNGVTYTISITTISSTSLPSAPVPATVGLGRSTHCPKPTILRWPSSAIFVRRFSSLIFAFHPSSTHCPKPTTHYSFTIVYPLPL